MARPKKGVTAAMRLWASVNKTPTCWLWSGQKLKSGKSVVYGRLKIGDKTVMAHRLSYELEVGPIPDDKQVCHTCDVGICVRPDHLFLGTQLDNVRDMISKGRQVYGRVVLTHEQITLIQRRYVPFDPVNGAAAIAKELGLNRSTVHSAATRRWQNYDPSNTSETKQ